MGRPVADALLDVLVGWGVRHVFTCPGSTEAAFLDALVERTDIELVLATNESVAVSMADGLARATGRPTLAYLHANVGLSNGLAHLYAAQLAYSPVVVLTGIKAASIQSRSGFTTARRMRDLVSQFVKDDWQSLTADAVAEDVNRAFTIAVGEPAGPVWVGIAQDLLERETDTSPPTPAQHRFESRVRPPAEALDAAANLLRGAASPVVVAGTEVARNGALPDLVTLAEQLGAPVVAEERRGFERPAFPTGHPNFAGHYDARHPDVARADVIFFAGCRVFHEFETASAPTIPSAARVIHSHPDVRQIGRVHGVDVGLVGDQKLVLADLVDLLADGAARPIATRSVAEPTAGPVPVTTPTPREPTPREPAPGHLRPADAVSAIAECARGSVVVSDATTAGGLLQRATEHSGADDYFATASGSLGWGAGAALGIKLGLPGRRVFAVLGDGVFQFGMPALWTAVHYRIPVTFVVLNNQRYAAVGAALRRFGGRAVEHGVYPGTDLSGPHIADIAAGFGLASERVTDAVSLISWLDAVKGADLPTLVEVMTDPDDFGP